jgi:hypothetical protein
MLTDDHPAGKTHRLVATRYASTWMDKQPGSRPSRLADVWDTPLAHQRSRSPRRLLCDLREQEERHDEKPEDEPHEEPQRHSRGNSISSCWMRPDDPAAGGVERNSWQQGTPGRNYPGLSYHSKKAPFPGPS